MSTVYKVVVKGQLLQLVQLRNIFYGDVSVVSPDTVASVWAEYLDSIYTPILPWLANSFSLSSFQIFTGTPASWFLLSEPVYTKVGTVATDALANLVSAVLLGTVAGSHAHGRKFFSGLAETAVNGNSLTASALTEFITAAAGYVSLLTTTAGSTLSPGIYTKDSVFRPFLTGFVSSLLGTMRRRKPGLGI